MFAMYMFDKKKHWKSTEHEDFVNGFKHHVFNTTLELNLMKKQSFRYIYTSHTDARKATIQTKKVFLQINRTPENSLK
jgi:hypothetical protein